MLINLAAFVVVVAGIISAKSLLIPFLLAIFLAIVFAPPLYWLRKKRVPTVLSVALVVGGVIILQLALVRPLRARPEPGWWLICSRRR